MWKKYSLGITLVIVFLAVWILMTWTDWVYFAGQQGDHHQPADVFGSSGYIWRWGLDTFSNWQADFLGQGLAVIFGAYLIFRGSAESKDTSEEVQQIVQDIERQVRGPEAAQQGQRLAQARIYRGGPLRNYGLGYGLLGAFLVSWILMTWMGWMHFAATATQHGQTADVFGSTGYVWEWARQTFQNWQSDALGHGLLIIVPAYLLFKGSAQSRESMDRIKGTVQRVQQALQGSEQNQPAAGSLVQETRKVQSPREPVRFWKKYGLGIVFLAFFVVSLILQTWTGWQYFVDQQFQHHSVADVFGASGYIWLWGSETFSNWQSDLLWDGLMILMGAYMIFQGSAESKGGDERMEQLADSIEVQVRGAGPARDAQARMNSQVSAGGIGRNRGLVYSFLSAGIICWALMTWMGWMNFAASQSEHGAVASVFGSSGYIWDWGRLTLENWQSDILGNAATVILSAYILYRGSGMSRDSDDEIEQTLERIQQALKAGQRPGQAHRVEKR